MDLWMACSYNMETMVHRNMKMGDPPPFLLIEMNFKHDKCFDYPKILMVSGKI